MQHKISNIYTCSLIEHISVYQPEHRCFVNAAFYWNTFHCSSLVPLCRRSDTEWLDKMTGETYFCRWACGHSRQPACLWLADRWYFLSLAARSCRHSWTAHWSRLCEETQEEQMCQEEQYARRWIHCWEPLMLLRTITIHRIWSVFGTVVSATTTSLFCTSLCSNCCVFAFGPWSRCQTRRRASGDSDWKSVWCRVCKA